MLRPLLRFARLHTTFLGRDFHGSLYLFDQLVFFFFPEKEPCVLCANTVNSVNTCYTSVLFRCVHNPKTGVVPCPSIYYCQEREKYMKSLQCISCHCPEGRGCVSVRGILVLIVFGHRKGWGQRWSSQQQRVELGPSNLEYGASYPELTTLSSRRWRKNKNKKNASGLIQKLEEGHKLLSDAVRATDFPLVRELKIQCVRTCFSCSMPLSFVDNACWSYIDSVWNSDYIVYMCCAYLCRALEPARDCCSTCRTDRWKICFQDFSHERWWCRCTNRFLWSSLWMWYLFFFDFFSQHFILLW